MTSLGLKFEVRQRWIVNSKIESRQVPPNEEGLGAARSRGTTRC